MIQISRMPRHWKFTQHHRTTRPPPRNKETDEVENLTYEEVLRGCKIAKGVYQQSLNVSSDNTTVFLKRSPSAININNYNKWMLWGWQVLTILSST